MTLKETYNTEIQVGVNSMPSNKDLSTQEINEHQLQEMLTLKNKGQLPEGRSWGSRRFQHTLKTTTMG